MFAIPLKGLTYHDRGDLERADFTKTNFTKDNNWHDLDLSALIPAGVRLVKVKALVSHPAPEQRVVYRGKGHSGDWNSLVCLAFNANTPFYYMSLFWLDENGVLEYKATSETFSALSFAVLGWFE